MGSTPDDTAVDSPTKREGPGSGRPKPAPPDRLARGTQLGRYMVLDELGAGGMGVVYAAYDPELDRKVAIKLLQADEGTEAIGTQAWLLREAQAMAKLSHPNVISVFDVGTLEGARVFVAMELVDGPNLRAWFKDKHPWREVLAVLGEAGRGLAHAHAHKIVHRDFKPDNVLVGKDRVRVMDFGLARLTGEREPTIDEAIITPNALSAELTAVGTVVGTRAYMAPELKVGEAATPRTDQYAFGVALYEALFGERPFYRDAPDYAKPRPIQSDTKVPARIQRAVLRAIAKDPAARFASMDELLVALAIDSGARRKWLYAGGSALAIAAGAIFFVARPAHEVCTGFEARLAGAWDAPTKLKIKQAFDATKRPFAGKEYAALEHSIDGYASEWIATAIDSCKATRVRGEQTEDALSLRQACLDRRRDELRAVGQQLANADEELVKNADKLASGLEPIARCNDVDALRAPGLVPKQPADKVAAALQALAESRAGIVTGRLFATVNAAKRAEKLADEIHYSPFRAEALVLEGVGLAGAANFEESIPLCTQAAWQAIDGHRDDVVVDGAMCAAVATSSQQHVGEARMWLDLAKHFAHRAGVDVSFDIRLLEIEGIVEAAAGHLDVAIAAQEKAIAIATRLPGTTEASLWRGYAALGASYAREGAFAKAIAPLQRALAGLEATVGDEHPDVTTLLTTLGACYAHAGMPDKARAANERALLLGEKVIGPNSAAFVATLNNMADGAIKAGDARGALVYLDRARAVADRTFGPANPLTHAVAATRAEALAAAGRMEDARAEYDATIELEMKYQSPYLGQTLASRATAEIAAKQWAVAATFAQRAIVVIEAGNGKDASDLFQPLAALARANLELGHRTEARAQAARALAIAQKAQLSTSDVEPVTKLLADIDGGK